ncbi:afadin isoform X1 [Ceratitis capitata]|nr:afadin isoform X1 [Ceratitis capitata]XP_004529227.1 afadin isoform X1 [Ceratitis capitata]XP_012158600.1 afadin isoform X1 [Ceratitis capitata]XP_012158601.1 afadin isoform X1 [Ceratitis capitata]XP_012158602.1 afadin isoform X1 [Ceratitis capitata]
MTHDRKMLDREAVRSVIQQWNANRLDLFALSEPDENLLFHGVMRFYFQDAGQKVATKCIRVASDATVSDVIDTLIEKFRPDMRMLSVPNYALYEVHANGEERRLNPDEKPLLVQLNWHIDDREGRFLLKNIDQKTTPIEQSEMNFKRKLSKREKKEQKKKEKLAKLNSESTAGGVNGGIANGGVEGETQVAGKLYTELPETSFTRSISNPEAVMRRRRQQKLEKKLQQFRSRDGGPDTGGTLKIYGESLCQDVPYKTLLLSIRDCAQAVVREMLAKYGLDKADPLHYCLVQVNSDGTEYILDDDECPLSILMNHPTSRGSIMFHVRRRPADSQPRRRKKKPLGASNGANSISSDREGAVLVEVTHSGDGGRRIKLGSDPIEVGSANTNTLQLFGPSIQARHCLISLLEGVCTVTPLHTDALTFVNGHHITQPTILHNGSVVMFGRVASYRFVDSPTDGRYNLALSQSQLDSACLYESRSPTSPGSWNDEDGLLNSVHKNDSAGTTSNNSGNVGGGVSATDQSLGTRDQDDNKQRTGDHHSHAGSSAFDGQSIEGNLENETKSISSLKSGGSNSQERSPKIGSGVENQGQEAILPAVLEFPETHQELFLRHIISELDVNAPHFKLAPVYSLYLCARYRASTHYRPELQPTERAHKLTIFLHHVANLIYTVVQEQYSDPRILAFWMANSSEFLHFLKSDRHISAFSVQAQEVLAESVQTAFRNLVNCFRMELSQTLNQFLSETIDHDSAAGLVLTVLGSAMALLRRCRVNAALTIQLFSQLFHYINVICFNTIVANSHMCTAEWGKVMSERLQLLELWAERQGLELAADCHLAKINQCAQFLQAPKSSVEEIQQLACSCFRLNSLQMSALLQQEKIPRNLVDTAIRMAESVADELTRSDGREVRLEESPELHLALLLPDDGFSCDVVRGIPSGLVDFLNPLQQQGMCRLAAQPTSIGLWTVYMHQFNARSSSAMSNKLPQPEVQVIKLHKNANGMGLSIVAAKGAGQERLGIYIKSVVPGGAADADGRLQAGDQLLRVDGQSLIGITQEKAADYLVRTGPVVTLEVAKQGAIYHGLATLLQQPSPVIARGNRRMSERDLTRMSGTESKTVGPLIPNNNLSNSKSVPALHHHTGSGTISMNVSKSRSTHSLVTNPNTSSNITGGVNSLNNNEQGFYQNLSVYRAQNQSQPILTQRPAMSLHSAINTHPGNSHNGPNSILTPTNGASSMHHPVFTSQQQQQQLHHLSMTSPTGSNNMPPTRPASAYYHNSANPSNSDLTSASNNQLQQHLAAHQPQQQFMHHTHNISASSTNLNSGSMSAATLQQYQQQQQQQLLSQMAPHSSLTMGNRSRSTQNFNRDMQNQHSLRMQQIMAPSMPNISGIYQQQHMSASQSMQNVNMSGIDPTIAYQNGAVGDGYMQQPQQQQHSPAAQTLRRNPRHELLSQGGSDGAQHLSNVMQQQQQQNFVSLPPKPGNMQQVSPTKQPQQAQQLPPTAPKPQPNRMQQQQYMQQQQQQQQQQAQQQQQNTLYQQSVEDKPPLPPTATHPLFKPSQQITPGMNYVASSIDPPKGGYMPISSVAALQNQKNFIGTNPWEREEREKEVEMRREHIRQWREQQIAELSSLVQRTTQQEEQLKTLILERDFERRALEVEEHEDESEPSYEKESVQEALRQQTSSMQTPLLNFRQAEVKTATMLDNAGGGNNSSAGSMEASPLSSARNSAAGGFDLAPGQQQQQQHQPPPLPNNPPPTAGPVATTIMQPKSILKNNRYDSGTGTAPSSPSKSQKSTSFADDRHLQTEHPISSLTKDISQMSINSLTSTEGLSPSHDATTDNSTVPPPPPPERNSSYLIMSQQKVRNSSIGLLKTATSNSADLLNQNQNLAKKANMLNNNAIINNNNSNANSPTSIASVNAATMNSNSMSQMSTGELSQSGYVNNMLLRDNKRVSFHDEENNYMSSGQLYGTSGTSGSAFDMYATNADSQIPLDLDAILEDRNHRARMFDNTVLETMPTTPDSVLWNTTVQSTPGVIGAQEVYRDPRQRRLAEKQQQQQQRNTEAVPEKLSFKEKMKMFALESGEDNTPKDKLKISRAQRDIDAVH